MALKITEIYWYIVQIYYSEAKVYFPRHSSIGFIDLIRSNLADD